MKKKVVVIAIALVIIVISAVLSTINKSSANKEILYEIKRGPFEVTVVNSGELEFTAKPQGRFCNLVPQ